MTKKNFSSFFIEGSLILHHIHLFQFLKRLDGVKKRRQKRDGLKRPKTPPQTHCQTHGQTRGQTQIQAGLNAQETYFERVYSWRLKKRGLV